MSFFHDECDFVDEDQYDFFTATLQMQRHSNRGLSKNPVPRAAKCPGAVKHGISGKASLNPGKH